ncbi:hypothetical protein GIB67_013793 [Kingdonia uniflora]|uniref:Protein kinase domain-containing protein n=1 Tax=Kingdonia uniflora TaxID=39325 RepID=A0A7J7N7U3_9MAGN|nr:hypothetical protein GIB67_013793 [Kingdonia uniflora]
MQQLRHLCFGLPTHYANEIDPSDQEHAPAKKKDLKQLRRCILDLVRRGIHCFCDRRWDGFCQYHPRKNFKKDKSGSFHDMVGVVVPDDKVYANNPRIFSFTELYIGSNGFGEDEVLGRGGFGRVYRALLPSDGTVVAVKCVMEKGNQFEKTFMAELVAVAQLRHRNLVQLRGWCIHEDQLLLVYDYMPNRSLDQILFRNPLEKSGKSPLNWECRLRIVSGLAGALFYLHEQLETQIIHRDVKTSNVMLDSRYNARLGDFGLARWLEHELQLPTSTPPASTESYQFRLVETTRIGGTIGYLPPESFQRRGFTTAKSDVFSFGIVTLEVATGRRAIDLAYPDEQIILLDWVRRLSDEGKTLKAGDSRLPEASYRHSEMEHLIHVGLLCSLNDPQLRPTMKWVVEAFSGKIIGKLPPLPSFRFHPFYISLSSPTTTAATIGTTTTTTIKTTPSAASKFSSYVTANDETLFVTANVEDNKRSATTDVKDNRRNATWSGRHRAISFPSVDTPREISYSEIIDATNNFSEDRRVAELDFGTAYHGYLNNRYHILVKRLGMKTCPALRSRFSDELRNLRKLRHRNLVQLHGWCTEQGEMLVVYDHTSRYLLSNLLFRQHQEVYQHQVLQWGHRYNIIKSLASAIVYLHEEWDEQVIHRNITSSAIILDPDMNPRLSCFALAEFLTRNEHGPHFTANPKRSVRGIFGYMAPEYVESGEATTSADVYSFGIVMLEVVSGYMAVDFRQPQVLLVKKVREFEIQKRPLVELADWRLDGNYDHSEVIRLVRLGMFCTRSDPDLRPSMRQIVSALDGNDMWLKKTQRKERREEWQRRNVSSLAAIRRIQALGVQ